MKLYNFWYLIKEGFHNLKGNRTMTIASVIVLVSCLILTGAATIFSSSLGLAMDAIEGNNSVTVYVNEDLPTLESVQIGEQIRQIDNVETCEFVSKDEALESMMKMLGDDGTVLEGLTGSENFLPDAFDISMKDLTQYDDTIKQISEIQGVDHITDYSDIAEKLENLDHLVNMVGICVVILLGVVSLFIIANTIRVTMYSRRMEISIMKSVGATNSFVRLPFVVEGMILGITSGVISLGFVWGLYELAVKEFSDLLNSFNGLSFLKFADYALPMLGIFVAIGVLTGVGGSLITMRKYLNKEGSEISGI